MKENKKIKIIISGGGTGGHIFPAVSIADEIKRRWPDADILFVGAEGRMEMTKVPQAGYPIVGLPIAGLQRRLTIENLKLPFKLIESLRKARRIIRDFKPDVVIGTGGYAGAPILYAASRMKIPTLIHESNSFAGLANKKLGKTVTKVCVAYDGMEKVFPAEKIVKTGNPVRAGIARSETGREGAVEKFGLDPSRPLVLVLGGSLGAREVNRAVSEMVKNLAADGIQLLWQCGKLYYEKYDAFLSSQPEEVKKSIALRSFIEDMDAAYAAADCIVSRAGASTVSELCLVGKPAILIPSPNVAEDHQTHNARALSEKNAAILIPESEMDARLENEIRGLLKDEKRRQLLSENIKLMAKPAATSDIVDVVADLL